MSNVSREAYARILESGAYIPRGDRIRIAAMLRSGPVAGAIDGQQMGVHEAHAVGYAKGHAAGVEAAKAAMVPHDSNEQEPTCKP